MIFAILLLMVSGALMGIWYGNAAGLAFFVLTTASVATILLMDISMPLTLSF